MSAENTETQDEAVRDAAAEATEADTNPEVESEATNADTETLSRAEAKKLRSEAKNLRDRLKAAEAQVEKDKNAKLSEQQKLQKQVEELTKQSDARDERYRNMLLLQGVSELKERLGVRSVKAMTKLIDTDALEFDLDSGEVRGIEDELKRLKKEDADLFIAGGTDGGAGGSGRAAGFDMNTSIRRAAGRR